MTDSPAHPDPENPAPSPRTVVVIGASSGIGRAAARLLARDGAQLVLAARSRSALDEVDAQCRALGAQTLVVPTDVVQADQVDALLAAAVARFGRVTAVIHTPAVVAYGRFEDVPAEVFDRVVTVGITGTANVARAALRTFRGQGGGALVITGSLLGKIATPYLSSYVTSKWAVHGLVRTLQVEARSLPGVSVSLVSPGGVDTPVYLQAANYAGWEGRPPPPVDPPEKVARALVAAIDRPRRERSVGIANPVVMLGFRLLPAVYDAVVAPLMRVGGMSLTAVEQGVGNVFDARPDGDAPQAKWDRIGLVRGNASLTGLVGGARARLRRLTDPDSIPRR